MTTRMRELAARREALVVDAELQRTRAAEACAGLHKGLHLADRGLSFLRSLKRKPLVVGLAVAAAPLGTRLILVRDGEPMAGVPMTGPITIALGPEGGIEQAEQNVFIGAAFLPVNLGDSTLRFETAGVAAVAIAAASLALSRQSNG